MPDLTAAQRLASVDAHTVEQASRCFIEDHEARIAEVERLRSEVARLRVLITRVLDIPRKPHVSEHEGALGRAYTRGWESVISALDEALILNEVRGGDRA